MSTALASWWNRFWFTPTPPTHLAVARIAFFGFMALGSLDLDSHAWGEFASGGWKPVAFYEYLGPLPSAPVLSALDHAYFTTALMATVGVLSRVSMTAAAVLGIYLLGLPNNFFKINHGACVVVYISCFLALSRAGDAWSVDGLIRRRRGKSPPPAESGEYTWPIRFAWLAVALIYFAAGVAKMLKSGVSWALSDNLKHLLIRHHYSHSPPTEFGLILAATDPLPRILGVASLSLELAAPLMLVHRYLRHLIGLGLCGMQVGIWLMMGVLFDGTIWTFVVFFPPWGSWIDSMRERFGHAPRSHGRRDVHPA